MLVKSKIIIAVVSITLISIILSGCLGVAEVKPEQIQVKDFKWLNENAYEIIINSDYDGTVYLGVFIADRLEGTAILNKGENIYRNDLTSKYNPTEKRQEQFLLRATTSPKKNGVLFGRTTTSSDLSSTVIVYSKIIDMPYLSVEIIPSSTLIHNNGDYLTLTNNGNIKGTFFVTNGGGCGIWANAYDSKPTIDPQESKKVNLEIAGNVYRGNDLLCKIEKGQRGTDKIRVESAFAYIENKVLQEIQLDYLNQ